MTRTDILGLLLAVMITAIGVIDHSIGLGFSEGVSALYTFGGLSGLATFAFFCFLKALSASSEEMTQI